MATRRLGNVHQEIEEVRSRLFLQRWDSMTFDVYRRLHDLGKLIDTEIGDELHRHVVVGANRCTPDISSWNDRIRCRTK